MKTESICQGPTSVWRWLKTWVENPINTLRPRQNGRYFPDDIFKCIFLNENVWISIKFSLKFVPKVPINNFPALVQLMACRRPGDKPLSEPMIVSLPTHICVTRPQWVKDRKGLHDQFSFNAPESLHWYHMSINSLSPGGFEWYIRWVIFKLILVIHGWDIAFEISLRLMSLDLTDDKNRHWFR